MAKLRAGWSFPDDATEKEIGEFIRSHGSASAPSDKLRVGDEPAPNRNREWGATIVEGIPYVLAEGGARLGEGLGGTYGLATGGPPGMVSGRAAGRVAGAYGGGFIGDAAAAPLRTALGEPIPPLDPISTIGRFHASGLKQAGMEAGGQVVGRGVQKLGRAMARGAYGVTRTTNDAWRGIDIPAAAIDRGIPAGRLFGRSGVEMAEELASKNAAKGNVLLEAAEAAGERVSIDDIAAPVIARAQRAARKGGGSLSASERADIIAQVKRKANDLLSEGETGGTLKFDLDEFGPTQAALIRQAADDAARSEFTKQGKRGFRGRISSLERLIGDGLRQRLARIPGYAAVQSEQRTLMAVRQASNMAAHRKLPTTFGALAGIAAGAARGGDAPEKLAAQAVGGALMGVAASPAVQSRVGIALSRPAVPAFVTGLPRAAGFGYEALPELLRRYQSLQNNYGEEE